MYGTQLFERSDRGSDPYGRRARRSSYGFDEPLKLEKTPTELYM
jgi:hypothetical protein